jgi:hypothetical protein
VSDDRKLAVELELLLDEAELRLRRQRFREASRDLTVHASTLPPAEARAALARLDKAAEDSAADDEDWLVSELIRLVRDWLVASQFEAAGAARLAELNVSLRED